MRIIYTIPGEIFELLTMAICTSRIPSLNMQGLRNFSEKAKNPFDRYYHLKYLSIIGEVLQLQPLPALGKAFWRMKGEIVPGRGERKR